MAEVLHLAVGYEVHELMLDRGDPYLAIAEGHTPCLSQQFRCFQKPYVPLRKEQLRVNIDLAGTAAAADLAARPAARVTCTRQRLSGRRQRILRDQEVEVA